MRAFFVLIFTVISFSVFAQENIKQVDTIKGKVLNAANDIALENVNIINLSTVKGTITNRSGDFQITASVNDTIYFSYLGFKYIKVYVSEDWKNNGYVMIKIPEERLA